MKVESLIEALGGEDLDLNIFPIHSPSYDKQDHLLRSMAHQPNHIKHFKNVKINQPSPDNDARLNHSWLISHKPIIRSRNNK